MLASGCIAAALLLSGGAATTASSLDVDGLWYTPDRNSIIEIRDCGDGTPCGVVAWVDPGHGGMTWDENNPNEHLRGRHMVGVTLLHGFERRDDVWRSGAIYNPKDGRTYRAKIQRLSDDALAVSGCLGPVCKKLVWERAEGGAEKLPEAGSTTAEVASL
ncbi:DUF2147 domain-containing protein [Parvularcula lutaonensis]|uniref:DUF2147 domain-containing protein n=1 Tax=Parvularcula lutaonensis TaxID=491923 RepID=A0ABV7MFM6_9PROT|nr:DUF2147 domain-containing protein [Parvularcula lutaonensis]GGY54627.1 hypothetical protein GCM10007148_25390 [Parvularcula lutaonensis]